jgi:hypothetical protein
MPVKVLGSHIAMSLQHMVEEYTLLTMSFQDTARRSATVTLEYMCNAASVTRGLRQASPPSE